MTATLYAGPPAGPGSEVAFRVLLADEHGFALRPDEAPRPSSWTVTFGLGGPAGGTYSEVRFADEALANLPADEHARERVLDDAVRAVVAATYGTAWAFHYRPEQYEQSVGRYGMRRREVLLVERLEVYP